MARGWQVSEVSGLPQRRRMKEGTRGPPRLKWQRQRGACFAFGEIARRIDE